MLLNLIYGYMVTQCLYAVVKLKIADFLEAGEKPISELAQLSESNEDALYRVLRCLSQHGVFIENKNKLFKLNDLANYLLKSNPNNMTQFITICGETLYQASANLLYTIKTGKPAFDQHYGETFWSFLQNNSNQGKIFNDAMEAGFNNSIDAILNSYDFSKFNKLIDLGGGKGQLVCSILANLPRAKGFIFDLPYIKDSAEQYIRTRKLENSCQFISGNFFSEVPDHGDAYLLRVILHDWSDEEAIKILQNCRMVMKFSAKLILIEKVILDQTDLKSIYLGDINMLISLTGKERTLKEYSSLLTKSGFEVSNVIGTGTAFSIIEATPVHEENLHDK